MYIPNSIAALLAQSILIPRDSLHHHDTVAHSRRYVDSTIYVSSSAWTGDISTGSINIVPWGPRQQLTEPAHGKTDVLTRRDIASIFRSLDPSAVDPTLTVSGWSLPATGLLTHEAIATSHKAKRAISTNKYPDKNDAGVDKRDGVIVPDATCLATDFMRDDIHIRVASEEERISVSCKLSRCRKVVAPLLILGPFQYERRDGTLSIAELAGRAIRVCCRFGWITVLVQSLVQSVTRCVQDSQLRFYTMPFCITTGALDEQMTRPWVNTWRGRRIGSIR